MYRLEDVLNQAIQHSPLSTCEDRNEIFVIESGVKISKDKNTGDIILYDVTLARDYYTKLTNDQLYIFKVKGWIGGITSFSMSKQKKRLQVIEEKIKLLINQKNFSQRKYDELKASRLRCMKQLTKLINLNSIK
tara:strand:- start:5797 stop:6198 length:402 start_codon:yes stop_codon:yes gene_type:complete